mgnify:CR=1 FL=1
MSKMLGNIGKATVGTARAGLNVGLATLKTPGAKLAQARSAALTRKSNIEKGITRKLGSRLGLRDDEYSRQKRIDKIGKLRSKVAAKKSTRPVQKINTDQKVPTPKALPAARGQKVPTPKALPAARGQKALPPASDIKALPPASDIKALPGSKETTYAKRPTDAGKTLSIAKTKAARENALSKAASSRRAAGNPDKPDAQRARRDLAYRRRMMQQREEFIYEVGQMKEKKLNKVIDILKGKKNNIEISPKIKESMNWKDNYKPIEIETTNLIEPKKLNPSDWRKEIFEI